jgi:shikimate kinase
MKLFIIGPGGVGKTTCGNILAKMIGYRFIDLDQEFCSRVGDITKHINTQGYESYCLKNSELFYKLLEKLPENFVFSLSSGFLIHKELRIKHKQTLDKVGTSILLLPSESLDESIKIIVERQMSRGLGLEEEREKTKFSERFHEYQKFGDFRIYSKDNPTKIAEQMKNIIYSN